MRTQRETPWMAALIVQPAVAATALCVVAVTVDYPALVITLSALAVAAPFVATLVIARRQDHPWRKAVPLAARSAPITVALIALIMGVVVTLTIGDTGFPDD